jgi:hypothetical protein
MHVELRDQRRASELASWRCDQLVHVGFPGELAALVAADGGYDLHALIELVERGCPPALASRILAPLEQRVEV